VTLFLAGDVMTGRGVDQILPHPSDPELREGYLTSAKSYVELAEAEHGPVPAPVDPHYVWGDGLALLERMKPQVSMVNLETSITTSSDFWPNKQVHYRMHPRNVGCLTVAGLGVCALANNHVLDFGRTGLLETLRVLREAGIATAGAGRDATEAERPACVAAGPAARVLVLALGSVTSGIPAAWAASSRPGVALLDDLSTSSADRVAARAVAERRPGDLVVVSLHWGSNWGYELSREQVLFARRLVQGGVDVVHGHSSHHVRAVEVYEHKLILYGAGDLITDYEGITGHEHWRGDLGVMYFATLSARDGRLLALRLAPMQMKRLRLTRAELADAAWLTERLTRISAPFGSRFELDQNGWLFESRSTA
jgi:poly-gamma-glutamate capsule biosynthesis protein CapA/YwtB (metallophosphatase superfamily)